MNENSVVAHLIAVANEMQSLIDTWYHSLRVDTAGNNLADDKTSDVVIPNGLSGVVRSFQILIRCLSLAAGKTEPQTKSRWGAVIYSCSKLFEKLIFRITPSLTAIASLEAAALQPCGNTGGSHTSVLTQLFIALLNALEPNNAPHARLLDAITYLALSAIGDALYVLTSGHGRPASIREEIMLDKAALDAPASERVRIVQAELANLWRLLKQILAVTLAFQRAKSPQAETGKAAGRSVGKLSLDVRKRLERTLVRCIWRDDPGDEMEDVLQRPVFKGPLPKLPKGYVLQDTEDWFVGEMFTLLGWKMLKRNGDVYD